MPPRAIRIRSASLLLAAMSGALGCGGSTPSLDAGPPPVDQCTNSADLGIIGALAAMEDGGIPDGGVPEGGPYPYSYQAALTTALKVCGGQVCLQAILNEVDAEQCMSECLSMTEVAGLSSGCIACQSETIRCAAANCINVCLGSDPALCDACGIEHCGARTVECTGLPQMLP